MGEHAKLRKKMNTHKGFLLSLYREKKGKTNRRHIESSCKGERNTLTRILFCISRGHIPIRKNAYRALVQSKRKPKLVHLGTNLRSMLKASPLEQKEFLSQFASLYHQLLLPLFNE